MSVESNIVVVLTALRLEYMAVRRHLTAVHELPPHKGTIYEAGVFQANGQKWQIRIVEIGKHNARAAAEAERAINYFNPRYIFFVGVAGGIKDVKLGDVVAATKVYGYESGKAKSTEFQPRPEIGLTSYLLEQRARAVARSKNWLKRVDPLLGVRMAEAYVGPIAAGEKVIASHRADIYKFLQVHYGDALAVEMEGYGILQAAHFNHQVDAQIVRGISDLIEGKDDSDKLGWQELAADHASAFVFEMIANLGTVAGGITLDGEVLDVDVLGPDSSEGASPYMALDAFREEDARFYFGREDLVERLIRVFSNKPDIVLITGPSGTGKSSLINAGVVARLRSNQRYQIFQLRPSSTPFDNLAVVLLTILDPTLQGLGFIKEKEALARKLEEETSDSAKNSSSASHLRDILAEIARRQARVVWFVLVIDQFEELFTLIPDELIQRRFTSLIRQLLHLLKNQNDFQLTVVLALRADFMAQAWKYPLFAEVREDWTFVIKPMGPPALQSVIEKPIQMIPDMQVMFEDNLVDTILDDLKMDPGSLPLLEFALSLLWSNRQNNVMTIDTYEKIGRVPGALTTYATEQFNRLTWDEKHQLRILFLKMIQPVVSPEGTEVIKDTRRVILKAELDEDTWRLAEAMIRARLFVADQDSEKRPTIEIVHEALITHWQTLRTWIEEAREARILQARLRLDLNQWKKSNYLDSELLRGYPLQNAKILLADNYSILFPDEKNYILHSIIDENKEIPNYAHFFGTMGWLLEFISNNYLSSEIPDRQLKGLVFLQSPLPKFPRVLIQLLCTMVLENPSYAISFEACKALYTNKYLDELGDRILNAKEVHNKKLHSILAELRNIPGFREYDHYAIRRTGRLLSSRPITLTADFLLINTYRSEFAIILSMTFFAAWTSDLLATQLILMLSNLFYIETGVLILFDSNEIVPIFAIALLFAVRHFVIDKQQVSITRIFVPALAAGLLVALVRLAQVATLGSFEFDKLLFDDLGFAIARVIGAILLVGIVLFFNMNNRSRLPYLVMLATFCSMCMLSTVFIWNVLLENTRPIQIYYYGREFFLSVSIQAATLLFCMASFYVAVDLSFKNEPRQIGWIPTGRSGYSVQRNLLAIATTIILISVLIIISISVQDFPTVVPTIHPSATLSYVEEDNLSFAQIRDLKNFLRGTREPTLTPDGTSLIMPTQETK